MLHLKHLVIAVVLEHYPLIASQFFGSFSLSILELLNLSLEEVILPGQRRIELAQVLHFCLRYFLINTLLHNFKNIINMPQNNHELSRM
jgi:hypothetical protein